MKMDRGSGILLPVFSLPSKYGIGTFGNDAKEFILFLEKTKQKYWQMLPLNPTSFGDSPYQSFSAFAINPYFIDFSVLKEKGYVSEEDLKPLNHRYKRTINYGELYKKRYLILNKIFENSKGELTPKIDSFYRKNKYWLDDYALFMVIKGMFNGQSWLDWGKEYRLRNKKALDKVKEEHKTEIDFWVWIQFVADEQYHRLKMFANHHSVRIIGDIPIYVALDSSDVWANYKYFQLDKDRRPTLVAGVPPDYFSTTGQLWGNPLYDYEKMKANDFKWWQRRVRKCTKLFDVLRIDHFRGMESYWAVPYSEATAIHGRWVKGPGMDLVNAIKRSAGKMEIIAEDLGLLTPEVNSLKEESGWPGLAVMEFAFSPDDRDFTSNYLPENFRADCVAYLGTHDNDTLYHFFKEMRGLIPTIINYLQYDFNLKAENYSKIIPSDGINLDDYMADQFITRMMKSKAEVVVFLMQDFLKESDNMRINTPGTKFGNWQYRLPKDYCGNSQLIRMIADYVDSSGR